MKFFSETSCYSLGLLKSFWCGTKPKLVPNDYFFKVPHYNRAPTFFFCHNSRKLQMNTCFFEHLVFLLRLTPFFSFFYLVPVWKRAWCRFRDNWMLNEAQVTYSVCFECKSVSLSHCYQMPIVCRFKRVFFGQWESGLRILFRQPYTVLRVSSNLVVKCSLAVNLVFTA